MPNSIGLNIVRAVKSVGLKAVSDNVTTFFGSAITINILNNDEYPIDKASQITVGTYSSITLNGNLTIAANKKTLTYTPKTNFFGVDTFTYNITDGYFKSNTATCSVSVYCKPPVIVDKSFTLQPSTTYTLDILNPNCHPGEIVFKDGLPDRDINSPQQSISIVNGSVIGLGITILETTNTTIKFRTKAITDKLETVALTYKIKNNLCELDNTQRFDLVAGGSSTNPTNPGGGGTNTSIGIITTLAPNTNNTKLRTLRLMDVPQSYTRFPMQDSMNNSDLSDYGCWFALWFRNYTIPDNFYIIMIGKPIINSNGTITARPTLFRGEIGPLGGYGKIVFYKPIGYLLDIWTKTDREYSGFQFGATDLFNPINGNRYSDINSKPTNSQVDKCLLSIPSTAYGIETLSFTDATDLSNIYPGTSKPSWFTA